MQIACCPRSKDNLGLIIMRISCLMSSLKRTQLGCDIWNVIQNDEGILLLFPVHDKGVMGVSVSDVFVKV